MKKLISLFLTVMLVLSLVPSAFAAERVSKFSDIKENAWYREEIDYALYNNFISGTSNSTFSPDAPVTRAQFVTIIGRMLNVQTSMYTSSKFEDVDMSSWYGSFVAWAAELGIVSGVDSRHFSPNSNITVEQMAVMMNNCISKLSMSPKEAPVTYNDMSTVSTWAISGMELMAKYNLLPVDASGNVSPRKQVTRAEAAVSLVRLAKATGMGVVPPTETPIADTGSAVAEKVKAIHDEMWATGKITASMTEKDKAIVYLRWMSRNTDYDADWYVDPNLNIEDIPWESHSAYGPLILGEGVCDGLAKAYKALLETEGISSYVEVVQKPGHRYAHAWTAVTVDGEEYDVDVTNFAGEFRNVGGSWNERLFQESVQQVFYHEEWQKQFEGGFGDPLTEEELQQMLEDMQAEVDASWGQ